MKLRLEENRIRASLEDEGKDFVLEIVLSLRHEEGKIVPVLVFGKTPEGSAPLVASIQRRLVRLLGPLHIALSGRKPFPLSLGGAAAGEGGMGRLAHVHALPKLPRL